MGKKGKKSRFNQIVDIDIQYSSNSVGDGTAEHLSELNLTKEKVDELQRLKAQLPSAPQAVRLEEEVAKIPENGPFRIVIVNVSFTATKAQIEEFLLPVIPTKIRIAEEDGRFRGYCFIDFSNRSDLAKTLEKNGAFLLGRRVNMRIADQQNDRGGAGGGFDRDSGFARRRPGGYESGPPVGASADGWRRQARPVGPPPPSSDGPTRWAAPVARSEESAVSAPAEPLARPLIKLAPRTKLVETPTVPSERQRNIFGDAKPVDTAARERQIEEAARKEAEKTRASQRSIFGFAQPVDKPDQEHMREEPNTPAVQNSQPVVSVRKEEPKHIEKPIQPSVALEAPKPNAWGKPLV